MYTYLYVYIYVHMCASSDVEVVHVPPKVETVV